MKAIFSFIKNSNAITSQSIELAALSNFCAKKQGFQTIFFGDDDSLKEFGSIEYNEKRKLNNDLSNFPKCFWSISKLIALSMMNEPCIHIDMDLLLTKPISDNFLKNDIVCFHDEFFNQGKRQEKLKNLFKILPNNCESIVGNSYNCGIIGGSDIISIKNGIKILLDFISLNNNYIDKINIDNKYSIPTALLIEQIWLFQIFKSLDKEINCLVKVENFNNDYFKMWYETGYIHLITTRKYHTKDEITKIIEKYNIKY